MIKMFVWKLLCNVLIQSFLESLPSLAKNIDTMKYIPRDIKIIGMQSKLCNKSKYIQTSLEVSTYNQHNVSLIFVRNMIGMLWCHSHINWGWIKLKWTYVELLYPRLEVNWLFSWKFVWPTRSFWFAIRPEKLVWR